MSTDAVVHSEIVRTQQQLVQLQADIAAVRQGLADVQKLSATGVIKSVQRGAISFSAGSSGSQMTATISEVNVSKSVLSFLGQVLSPQSGIAIENAFRISARLELGPTTVTALRVGGEYGLGSTTVAFQVVEYY